MRLETMPGNDVSGGGIHRQLIVQTQSDHHGLAAVAIGHAVAVATDLDVAAAAPDRSDSPAYRALGRIAQWRLVLVSSLPARAAGCPDGRGIGEPWTGR